MYLDGGKHEMPANFMHYAVHYIRQKSGQSENQMWFESLLIVVEIPLLPSKVNLTIDNLFFLGSPNIEGRFPKNNTKTNS